MRLTSCLAIIWLMPILSYANATKGKYTVIAPGTIHCNEKYTIAVAVHHTNQSCLIKASITGHLHKESKQLQVTQNKVKHVEFTLPCLGKGDYNLTVEAIDCLQNFKNTTKLIYKKFYNHVRIQADKDFYQLGDNINFRVLFLDKDLRPAQPEQDAVIWFEDGKLNRIKEIKDFKTMKGVYSGTYKISEFAVTGGWNLGVSNGGEYDRTLHFEVDKYIFPKFVVKVEATKSVSVKDGDMQIVVRANYNNGKPLDGNVNVVLFLEIDHIEAPKILKTAEMVKGKAKIDLNIKEYNAYVHYRSLPFYLTTVATVEEKFTGIKINATSVTSIYNYRYSKNCINYDDYAIFEVDKEKDILFQITYIDGSYLNDTKSTVELICKQNFRGNNGWHGKLKLDNDSVAPVLTENYAVTFKGHMNETGFVTFKVALPALHGYHGYSHYYSLELKYLDEQHEVCDIDPYWNQHQVNSPEKENPDEYFILEDEFSSTNRLHLKKASQFTLNSSQSLSYFDYNVIGRGNILESGRIELPDKPKVYNLTLTPQFSWAPSFYVYVNYVDENGKYHFAEQLYVVVFELENQINITVAKQVKPGENVALEIQTAPNSFVSLTAVDQTHFLLRSDNDLNFFELKRVLGSYNTYTLPQGGYSTYPGEMSGCITLTNADYFYSSTKPKNMTHDLLPAGIKGAAMYSNEEGISDSTNANAPKGFSQTWFFADIENTEASKFLWIKKIPATITSWVLTAFSSNPQKGLGITMEPTKVKTFQPFFISIRLPHSLKRGEVINVPAWVFNYLDSTLDVEVTLHNRDDEYEFIKYDNEVVNEQKLSKSIRIPSNGAAGTSFLIKPKVVGNIMLKFTAISAEACDTIHKAMKVVLEGVTLYANRAYFVTINKGPEFNTSFVLELPKALVADSEHVEVGVMGDILAPVLKNLDNLVRLPTGCGEQAMSTLLLHYLLMKYLNDSNRLTPNIETNLRYYLEAGYQNILNYRHKDGSFSSFGLAQVKENHRNGSTWLTAYVVRSLQQIKEFISVDGKIIEDGLEYLSKQQAINGTFTETGDNFYASQSNHVSVTSSAVLAIMENATYAEKYSYDISKGLDFIVQNIGKSDSLHAQAIGTYTLNKARHAAAKYEIYKLKALAKTESDLMWSSEEKYNVFSSDVEITSYALLTLLDQQSTKIDDVLPIVNWLIAQRNSHGGFVTTQDTVVGLTALIEFSKFAGYEPAQMTIDIESKDKKETIKLTQDNEILYQNVEMPPKTKSINFTAKGTGSALVQIAYQYSVFEKDPKPSFIIKTAKVYSKNTPLRLHMVVCVYYVGEGDSSNMALLEFSTPSGYVIDDESLKEIKESWRVVSAELKYSDTLLVVYFDRLYKNYEICILVQAIRTHAVAMQKSASIVIYDYYDTSKKATVFYEVKSKLCDICENAEECPKCI